jgi:hypothetical protein
MEDLLNASSHFVNACSSIDPDEPKVTVWDLTVGADLSSEPAFDSRPRSHYLTNSTTAGKAASMIRIASDVMREVA